MPAKLRQLGCVCVAPTPLTHACAAGGRSARRLVEPWNTMRTAATVADGEGGPGADDSPSHAVNPATKTRAHTLTRPDYCSCARTSPRIGVRSAAAGPADTDEFAALRTTQRVKPDGTPFILTSARRRCDRPVVRTRSPPHASRHQP